MDCLSKIAEIMRRVEIVWAMQLANSAGD